MRYKYDQLRTRFAREVRFEVKPVQFRAAETTQLEKLKDRLLRLLLGEASHAAENRAFPRADTDAAARGWGTRYPLLVFPTLLEEKARVARAQTARQAGIRERSNNLL